MSDEIAEIRDELRKVAREMLVTGADWSQYARVGWLGLEVAEDLGGSGAGFGEVAVILQEMGRAASRSSYVGTVALGVGALNLLEGPDALEPLAAVAAGELRLAVALPAGDAVATPFQLDDDGGGLRLHGETSFVADAARADRILIVADDPGGAAMLTMLDPGQPGLLIRAQDVVDQTREFATVTAAGIAVNPQAVWSFRGDPALASRTLLDRGALAAACDSLGVAEAMLDATVAYAGVRRQFGRFIGSFQAVKHACADMLVGITIGRELLAAAVDAVAAGDEDAWVAVSMAKSYLGTLGVDVAGKAMQLHGGYGYTWESGVPAFLKRALLGRSLFGSPAAHRARLAARYG